MFNLYTFEKISKEKEDKEKALLMQEKIAKRQKGNYNKFII